MHFIGFLYTKKFMMIKESYAEKKFREKIDFFLTLGIHGDNGSEYD